MTAVLNISIYTFGPALLFRPGVNTFKPARSSGLFQVNLAHNKDQASHKRDKKTEDRDKSTEGLLWFIPCTIYPIIPVVPGISVSGYNESRWGRKGRPTVIRMTFMTTEVMDAKSLDFMETNTMFCIVISSNS